MFICVCAFECVCECVWTGVADVLVMSEGDTIEEVCMCVFACVCVYVCVTRRCEGGMIQGRPCGLILDQSEIGRASCRERV